MATLEGPTNLGTEYHRTVAVVNPSLIATKISFVLPVVGVDSKTDAVNYGIVLHGMVNPYGLPTEKTYTTGNSYGTKVLVFFKNEGFSNCGIEEITGRA